MDALGSVLRQGLADLRLDINARQFQQLLDYLELLQKWNRVYNLTAVRSPHEMLTHHVLDSLAAVPPLAQYARQYEVKAVLDVGSGGGLPGVVFAICLPELAVTCVDAVGKKAAFIQQVAAGLGLYNLKGVHARVEQLQQQFDVISSRAFASLKDFTDCSRHALADKGVWLAMKGKYPQEELQELPPSVDVFHVEQFHVPGLSAERCLIWLRAVQ